MCVRVRVFSPRVSECPTVHALGLGLGLFVCVRVRVRVFSPRVSVCPCRGFSMGPSTCLRVQAAHRV